MTAPNEQPKPPTARDIFLQLIETPKADRAAQLDEACRDNAALRADVESLLAAHDNGSGFMDHPTASVDARSGSAPITEKAGSQVGPYKILQLIGEGGFGSVFLAEQTLPIRRRVALKIIKLGMDTRQIIARFDAERQALALMHHPHIASVVDAGATDTGRPYFVMEYVVGDPITKFADAHKLNVRERLELFTQVCSAIQHAHTKGVIHRDIKPGNVLVSMTDGKPYAKVIDFGIAKATASPLTDKTLFTEHRQLLGTLEYMSPEQAEGLPDIDTRTDVYALGVLLYELLTGETPLDGQRLRSAAWDEMRRMIKEEEPLAPSLKLSRSVHALAEIAQARNAEPIRLSAQIRGELDWIAIKALEKDRARRYESASDLAADIRRHLSGDAIVAAPPSRSYRLRKVIQRNRTAFVITTIIVAALLLTSIGTGAGMLYALNKARLASAAEAEANQARDREAEALAAERTAREAAQLAQARARLEQVRTLSRFGRFSEATDRLFDVYPTADSNEWRWAAWEIVRDSRMDHLVSIDEDGLRRAGVDPDDQRLCGMFTPDGESVAIFTAGTDPIAQPLATIRFRDGQVTAGGSALELPKIWTSEENNNPITRMEFEAPDPSASFKWVRATVNQPGTVILYTERSGETYHSTSYDGRISPGKIWIDWIHGTVLVATEQGEAKVYLVHENRLFEDDAVPGRAQPILALWASKDLRYVRVLYEDWTAAQFFQLPKDSDTKSQPRWLVDDPNDPAPMSDMQTTRLIEYAADGDRLYAGSYSGWVTAFSTEDRSILWTKRLDGTERLSRFPYLIGELEISPDQRRLLVSSAFVEMNVLDAENGDVIDQWRSNEHSPRGIFIDDDQVVYRKDRGTLVLRRLSNGDEQIIFDNPPQFIYDIAYDARNRRLGIVTHNSSEFRTLANAPTGNVILLDMDNDSQVLWSGEFDSGGRSIAFSPDGAQIATAERLGRATLWDATTGEHAIPLEFYGTPGHTQVVSGIAYHPTQPVVATASHDSVVRLWDTSSGFLLADIPLDSLSESGYRTGRLKDLAFAPDGRTLSMAYEERIIHIDLTKFDKPIRELQLQPDRHQR